MAKDTFNLSFERPELTACYTVTVWRLILSDVKRTIIASSFGLAIPSAILLNISVCVALYKTKQVSSPSKFLFFLLCMSDSFSGMVSIPVSVILFSLFGGERCCWLEQAGMFLGQTNGHFSIYLVLSIAVQRYIKIKYSMREPFLVTKSGSWALAIGCFVWSALHGLVSTYFFNSVESKIPNIVMMVVRAIFTITIYLCYFFLYWSVKKQAQLTVQWSKSSEKPEVGLRRSNDHISNFFRTIYLILIVLAVCYIPLVIMDLWTGYYSLIEGTAAPQMPRFLYFLMHFPLFVNCSLNAAIFLYRNKECKAYLKNIFMPLFFRKGSRTREQAVVKDTTITINL